MLKPILGVLLSTVVMSQMALACPNPGANGCETVSESLEQIRPANDSSIWKSFSETSERLKADYIDGINAKKTGGSMAAGVGSLIVAQGVMAEVLMKAYGTKDPMKAFALAYVEFQKTSSRFAIQFTTPGSVAHEAHASRIAFANSMKSKEVLTLAEAKQVRNMFRGMTLVGLASVGLGSYLYDQYKQEKAQDSSVSQYSSPDAVIKLLATDISNTEIEQMASRDEVLRSSLQGTAAYIRSVQMWNEVYQ